VERSVVVVVSKTLSRSLTPEVRALGRKKEDGFVE
jgi:hypothetical protein